jgi:hypothetical protein
MEVFRPLINQKVERLFIVLWPPHGEETLLQVDISLGFVFASNLNQLCVISNNEDMWTPYIRYEPLPSRLFNWEIFDIRLKNWMNLELKELDNSYYFDNEYYEVTNSDIFQNIVSHSIQSIEFIGAKGESIPFGTKLIFEKDYVLTTPNAYGNTVETSCFNKNNNMSIFEKLFVLKLWTLKC